MKPLPNGQFDLESGSDRRLKTEIPVQSEQLGAQIGPALRASSDALRAKRRLEAEEMAQKAAIKILFPLVFFVLPAMFLVILGPPVVQSLRTLAESGF